MECRIADLSKYRFSCCHEVLGDAKIMYEAGRYKTALNRVYYSIFHGMRAVTALGSFDSNKHSGVIVHLICGCLCKYQVPQNPTQLSSPA